MRFRNARNRTESKMACKKCGKPSFGKVCSGCKEWKLCIDCGGRIQDRSTRCHRCNLKHQKAQALPKPKCADCGGVRSIGSAETCRNCYHRRARIKREAERVVRAERVRREWKERRRRIVKVRIARAWEPEEKTFEPLPITTGLARCGFLR